MKTFIIIFVIIIKRDEDGLLIGQGTSRLLPSSSPHRLPTLILAPTSTIQLTPPYSNTLHSTTPDQNRQRSLIIVLSARPLITPAAPPTTHDSHHSRSALLEAHISTSTAKLVVAIGKFASQHCAINIHQSHYASFQLCPGHCCAGEHRGQGSRSVLSCRSKVST